MHELGDRRRTPDALRGRYPSPEVYKGFKHSWLASDKDGLDDCVELKDLDEGSQLGFTLTLLNHMDFRHVRSSLTCVSLALRLNR